MERIMGTLELREDNAFSTQVSTMVIIKFEGQKAIIGDRFRWSH